jgi:hypothetical protein
MEKNIASGTELIEAIRAAFRKTLTLPEVELLWKKLAIVIKNDKKILLLNELEAGINNLVEKTVRKALRYSKAQEKIEDRQRRRRGETDRIINEALEHGYDLVEIPAANTTCGICAGIEGKVYSITGKTPGYPLLTEDKKPPLCGDCVHYLRIVPKSYLLNL